MLLKEQTDIQARRPMPVEDTSDSSKLLAVTTNATVQMYYYNAGTETIDAGQAAGVAVIAQLAYRNIYNSIGSHIGQYRDTSVAFTSTALTTEVEFPWEKLEQMLDTTATALLAKIVEDFDNGDYCIDYVTGTIYGKKASTQVTLTSTTYNVVTTSAELEASSVTIGGISIDQVVDIAVSAKNAAFAEAPIGIGYEYEALGSLTADGGSVGDKVPLKGTTDGVLYVQQTDGTTTPGMLARTTAADEAAITADAQVVYAAGSRVIPPYTHSSGRGNFTATFTSSSTITLAGTPDTVGNDSIVYIKFTNTGGTATKTLVNGVDGVNMTVSSNVITVTNAGTPFASGDTYDVGLNLFKPAYDKDNDVNKSNRENPEWAHYVSNSLVDTTNVSAATVYYPATTGGTLDGYTNYSISGKWIDADGTITMTVEMMNDEDTTSGDWIQVYGYDDKNNTTVNSWAVTNGTLTFANSFNAANYTNYRVKVIYSGSTNTAILKERKIS